MGIFKWIGGFLGWMVGGPLGLLAGLFIGSMFDSDDSTASIGSGGYTGGSYTPGGGNYDAGQRNSFLFSMMPSLSKRTVGFCLTASISSKSVHHHEGRPQQRFGIFFAHNFLCGNEGCAFVSSSSEIFEKF